MKKISMLILTMGLLFGFFEATCVYAFCPDYKIVCQDQTCRGPYSMCWSWKDFICVPCHDNNASVCNNNGGPKCVWLSNAIEDIVLAYLCRYVHIPDSYCVVCKPPPACVKGEQ